MDGKRFSDTYLKLEMLADGECFSCHKGKSKEVWPLNFGHVLYNRCYSQMVAAQLEALSKINAALKSNCG